MNIIKIRYNTEHNGSNMKWRAITIPGWEETLFEQVIINAASHTTEDVLPDGRIKHHITVEYKKLMKKDNYLIIE
jgi:hypothetical protein